MSVERERGLARIGSRGSLLAGFFVVCTLAADVPLAPWAAHGRRSRGYSAPKGVREPLTRVRSYELRAGAFSDSGRPDVAVHIPPGFDPTWRPGVVVYFHGWHGCVATALADEDSPCSDGGDPRPAAALATQIDAARVNALLVAVELRADMPTGETGQLALPGGLHDLLRELFAALAAPLASTLDVDELDRVVVVAHSGGYQAAASVVEFGDVPQITEVDLLDALYGADDVFSAWVRDAVALFDPRVAGPRRFIDLYTCCGGTLAGSRAMARAAVDAVGAAGWPQALYDDDGESELDAGALAHAIVFKRVPRSHAELPFAYVRLLVESAGFARL